MSKVCEDTSNFNVFIEFLDESHNFKKVWKWGHPSPLIWKIPNFFSFLMTVSLSNVGQLVNESVNLSGGQSVSQLIGWLVTYSVGLWATQLVV